MIRWLLAAMIGAGAPLAAQQPDVTQRPDMPAASTAPAAAPVDTIGLSMLENRMTVPVSIGAHGPYPFIIDTGAERSVVSRELAGLLGLAEGRRVRVTTMAGQGELATFLLPALRVSSVAAAALEAPGVDVRNLGAPGMLGIDALKGYALSIDFDRNLMEVRPAARRVFHSEPGDIVVRARNVFGQLIVTDARYRGNRVSVVIDTGSPVTIGNLALLRRIKVERSLGPVSLLSVTGQSLAADMRVVDTLRIGGIDFHGMPIAFADAVPFQRFGLSDTPALMLGMDALRLFRRVEIDFANRQIRLTLPKSAIVDAPAF